MSTQKQFQFIELCRIDKTCYLNRFDRKLFVAFIANFLNIKKQQKGAFEGHAD